MVPATLLISLADWAGQKTLYSGIFTFMLTSLWLLYDLAFDLSTPLKRFVPSPFALRGTSITLKPLPTSKAL